MSKRDSIIISILVSLIIAVLGYSLLINTQSSKLNTEKASRDSLQTQLNETNAKIQSINTLKKTVEKMQLDNQNKNNEFCDHMTDFEMDSYLRSILKDAGVPALQSLEFDKLVISELSPYDVSYKYPTYPLLGSRPFFDEQEDAKSEKEAANSDAIKNTASVAKGVTQLPSYNVNLTFDCDWDTLSKVIEQFSKPQSNRSIVVNSISAASANTNSVTLAITVYFLKPIVPAN